MNAALRGLLIGSAGGALCWLAGLPAPWLAGSMIAAIVAVFAGIAIGMPDWLKTTAFILLGIQTGTSVTWETVERASQWPLSIALLAVTMVAITWACTQFYTRQRKWDGPTALFASLPGALALVLLLASASPADMRRVSIAQCIRLFFLVAALPAVITLMSPDKMAPSGQASIGSAVDVLIVVAGSVVAGLTLERLRVPAGLILGPTLCSAGLELSGLISGTIPMALLIPANVILGVMIASRFTDFTFAEFRQALGEGFSGFLIALAISAAGALTVSLLGGLPFALTLLAFSPGGLEAMTIMAFALDLDPAYVGAHQVARYVGMALLMPLLTGLVLRRMGHQGNVTSSPAPSRIEGE